MIQNFKRLLLKTNLPKTQNHIIHIRIQVTEQSILLALSAAWVIKKKVNTTHPHRHYLEFEGSRKICSYKILRSHTSKQTCQPSMGNWSLIWRESYVSCPTWALNHELRLWRLTCWLYAMGPTFAIESIALITNMASTVIRTHSVCAVGNCAAIVCSCLTFIDIW